MQSQKHQSEYGRLKLEDVDKFTRQWLFLPALFRSMHIIFLYEAI